MADKYFAVPQGRVFIAERDASGLTTGYKFIGDTDGFTITTAQQFLDIYESFTGDRNIVAHIPTQTDISAEISILNIDAANLAKAYYGEISTAASGAVTGEAVTAYADQSFALKNPGVSSVVVKKGATTLVLGTDYSVEADTGVITILPGSTQVTGSAGVALTIDYSHTANKKIKGFTQGLKDYSLEFAGKSRFDSKGQKATIHRIALDLAATLSLIGTGVNKLVLKGKLLPAYEQAAGESQYFTYVQED